LSVTSRLFPPTFPPISSLETYDIGHEVTSSTVPLFPGGLCIPLLYSVPSGLPVRTVVCSRRKMRPHDKAATFGSLVVGPAGARPDGAAAAIGGMYLGPWQEYALWRAHTQRAAAGSPSFALRAAESGTRGGSVGGRETAALSADRRSSGSSFSRSLMSMSPASGAHAGPASVRSTAADSVSDGQSVRSLIDGSARLRRAGVSSTRPALPRSGRPQPKQPVPAIDAQERIERLRALYGMAPQAPPAGAATLRPQFDAFISDIAVDGSLTDTSIQPASAAVIAPIASDASDTAARAAREAQLVSLLQAQATRQAALEAQLERQQAVSLQMNAALTRLLEGGGAAAGGRDAAPRMDGASSSASSLAAATIPQQQLATQSAASDLDTASWLPVRAIARHAPSRLAGTASSAPSAPTVLPAFGGTAAGSLPPPPAPVALAGASALGGVGDAARPGGVDHLLRFMGRAQPSARAAAVNDSGGGGGCPVLSVERAGNGTCLAQPGMSPPLGTSSPARRGSVPDAAADDLLLWSLALRDDTYR